jgi:predicted oxidoreductase (fatty acid repression mutant protein)
MKCTSKTITAKLDSFINTLKLRHSDYSLSKDSVLSETQLIDFIKECIYYHPSAFNVQSTRVVILLNEQPYKL